MTSKSIEVLIFYISKKYHNYILYYICIFFLTGMLHYRHWKISDNVEHQIREDGQFGKVKCSFVGNVYQYVRECRQPSSQVRKIH